MRQIFFILIGMALVFQACTTGEEVDKPAADRYVDADRLMQLPRTTYERGGVKFSIASLDGLYGVPKDSIPWSARMLETAQNGQIAYYFLQGEDIEMNASHIRVEYIAKSLPGAGTYQELFDWLKSLYVGNERQGQVLEPGLKLKTADNQEVELLQIQIPQFVRPEDSAIMSAKQMAWAYVDHGDRYVGMNLTTTTKGAYNAAIPMMKDIIRSYRKE